MLVSGVSFGTKKPINTAALVVEGQGQYVDPFAKLPGETSPESKPLSPTDKRYVFHEITTKPGFNNNAPEKLPHGFLTTIGNAKYGKHGDAAVLGIVYRDKNGEPMLYAHDEFRPCVGRPCLTVPGGDMDAGESPEKAALREFQEESRKKFKRTGPLYMMATPISEQPCMNATRVYLGVTSGELKETTEPDKRDAVEKALIGENDTKGIPIKTLLDPAKLREYVLTEQRKIVDSKGTDGRLMSPPVLMLTALMGDVIADLAKSVKKDA